MRSAETCVYVTRFSETFRDCPLFAATAFTPKTWAGRLLQPHTICRHLEVAGAVDRGPFYPRCELGGPEAVRRLARGQGGAA